MIGNPFRRHLRPRVDDVRRVPTRLMFSAYYDASVDHIVIALQAGDSADGSVLELSLWDAVSVQDVIGAAIGDAVAAGEGTV
ncbi:hypothetical protein OHB26_24745 [Nocardia sp. NBC_01503]|uniref:hypothetical protein n=1 Tax=Nocardia sp. NBC_01503 TaxID=2975997 RepID=UPI002E7B9821|nr:hypothetical protein [Nocardia sp. NBC_01503]WTL30149.1 hypothetical protein OHB26_24745 [Nocardia sp. NBC_01503]